MARYLVDLREMRFVLFELFRIQDAFPGSSSFAPTLDTAAADALLLEAREFAARLGDHQGQADSEGTTLTGGTVHIPAGYAQLWEEYRRRWSPASLHARFGSPAGDRPMTALPPLLMQALLEMMMGADASFMIHGGFNVPATRLLLDSGTDAQRGLVAKLLSYEWDACLCATEPGAGSDLSAVQCTATPLGDGVFEVHGEKVFVSAGRHELTSNTIYFALGRCAGEDASPFSLSCLIVPRYWVDAATGRSQSNNVACVSVADKMGLKGCANVHLVFGQTGTTRGWILGDKPHVGLTQLLPLMLQARMATGLFAVAIASSAYLHAFHYARHRVQGRRIDRAIDPNAPRVTLIEHMDVRRMLLDMRSTVEGCRILVARLVLYASLHDRLRRESGPDAPETIRARKLAELLTPVAKAYVSDQATRVCEMAMQVHGAVGYTRQYPVEQYLRDVKAMSIWEGTNYIQAQDLVRHRLAFGRQGGPLGFLLQDIEQFMAQAKPDDELAPLYDRLRVAIDDVKDALKQLRGAGDRKDLDGASWFFTRFLEIFAEICVAWGLLEAAQVARQKLAMIPDGTGDRAFYAAKIETARYFFHNRLANIASTASLIAQMHLSVIRPDEATTLYWTGDMTGQQ